MTEDERIAGRPVTCESCDWVGFMGDLVKKPHTVHCPACGGLDVRYVIVPMPERAQ